jgi:hypothetical protein
MTVAPLVDWLVEELSVPVDLNDAFLRRYNIEKFIHSVIVAECALRQEDGYPREQRVAHERVLA